MSMFFHWNSLYYAGGVPAIMEEIKEHLHLDVMTVTGKTLGENLVELKANGYYEGCENWLHDFNEQYGVSLTREDIIRPYEKAIGTDGSIAILRGNLAPEAADGGPIALVEDDDLIEIDVMERKLNIIGVKGERKGLEEMDMILAERKKNWQPRELRYKTGVLRLFSEHAVSPMKGAYLDF